MTNKWDERFMRLAEEVSQWSKDPEQKVGCVLVSPDRRHFSVGYNGFAKGIIDSKGRLEDKDFKNELIVHAEQNAVYNSTDVNGWTAYSTKHPCTNCANALIQAGVTKVVSPRLDGSSAWYPNQHKAKSLMLEAGLELVYI